jgi:hypothetical protein
MSSSSGPSIITGYKTGTHQPKLGYVGYESDIDMYQIRLGYVSMEYPKK